MDQTSRDELIELLFSLQLSHKDILICLAHCGSILSERHLRRILSSRKLFRRDFSEIDEVAVFIHKQLATSGLLHGYRWMWQKLLDNGLRARREDVRLIMKCLDPSGVVFR